MKRKAEDPKASAGGGAAPKRRMRYRRRLRTRIILSFVLLGFSLTLLFAWATNWTRARVENQLIEDVMNRNISNAARQFDTDPTNREFPFDQVKAYVYTPDRFESLRNSRPEWYALSDGIAGMVGTDVDGEEFAYKLAVRKTPQAWFFLAYDITEAKRSEERFNHALYASVLLFTLLSLVLGWWSASRVMSPVSELAKRLKESGRSAATESLAHHFPDDEVGQLAEALDDYAGRLTEVVQRDREFNADVSHELRTPLAVIRGAVELLLSHPQLDEKTRTRVMRIQRAEQQCTDLISALLLLSRNERGHGTTDVAKLAEQSLGVHRTQLAGKPLVLRLEHDTKPMVIDAPESAVAVALGNLIGNAVKYTIEGEVIVRMLPGAVQVIDSGPGLSAEDAAGVFQRGYRGTHAGHTQGGGIGLSIVRRLCALYGWRVSLEPGPEFGVIATLTFNAEDPAGADGNGGAGLLAT